MPFHPAAHASDILSFREIHLEQKPGPCAEWQKIMRSRRRQFVHLVKCGAHGMVVNLGGTRCGDCRRSVEAEMSAISLAELMTAPVPVKVAVGANVHDDVERVGSAAEGAREIVALG